MIATIALALSLAIPGQSDKAQIDALCAKIAKATQGREWKQLAALCTFDFHQRTLDGQTLNLQKLTQGFDQLLPQFKNRSCTYKIIKLKITGNVAVGELYWTILGERDDPMGRTHKIELSDYEQDTFKKVNGHWLEAAVKEEKDVQKVDGKEIKQDSGGIGV